jgi:hypothetical protein
LKVFQPRRKLQEPGHGGAEFVTLKRKLKDAVGASFEEEGFVSRALLGGDDGDDGHRVFGFDGANGADSLTDEFHRGWGVGGREQVVGDLDDQIKVSVAAKPDKLANPRCSGASDGGLALANLLKEGLDEVAEQPFAVADEDMVGFHVNLTVALGCTLAGMRAFSFLVKQAGCHYRECEKGGWLPNEQNRAIRGQTGG